MLEPTPKNSDPYQRPRDQGQDPVVDNEDPDQREYEIEALLDKREVRKRVRGIGTITEYLVEWKHWGPAHNVWYRSDEPAGCQRTDGQIRRRFRRSFQEGISEVTTLRQANAGRISLNPAGITSSWT